MVMKRRVKLAKLKGIKLDPSEFIDEKEQLMRVVEQSVKCLMFKHGVDENKSKAKKRRLGLRSNKSGDSQESPTTSLPEGKSMKHRNPFSHLSDPNIEKTIHEIRMAFSDEYRLKEEEKQALIKKKLEERERFFKKQQQKMLEKEK